MQDWRVADGYYHYELDKSKFPAYPFRLSARDAARYGLLFARGGMWGDEKILSKHWVDRSSALYSIDNSVMGYGFMWWVFREPRFEQHGMFSALGVGNQMIAVLPESDIVIVNRANTYDGEGTPMGGLLDLIEKILEARTGTPVEDPDLVSLATNPDPKITHVSNDRLSEFVGEWPYPPSILGRPTTSVEILPADGHLVTVAPRAGTFRLYLQPDGSLLEEDTLSSYLVVREDSGAFVGICAAEFVVNRAMEAIHEDEMERAEELLARVDGSDVVALQVGRAIVEFLNGDPDAAESALRKLADRSNAVEPHIQRIGDRFLEQSNAYLAEALFELNAHVFP
jgi:hypothetical protein